MTAYTQAVLLIPDTGRHDPARLDAVTALASWRRAYLRTYGAALAARIAGHGPPHAEAAGPGELYRGHGARAAAERDAVLADLTVFVPRSPRPGTGRVMPVPRCRAGWSN
jgi:hypothetical protein